MDRLGKYELRAVLGRGAMGTVYEGWDPVIARRVAIKTVRQPDDADSEEREQLDRFQQEAQAAGRLHHPNIVGVFDYAETGEIAYIVMEFVSGRSLKAVLDAGALPLAEIGPLMDGLLSGLEYSHAHQVIHRDIKPANVIVTEEGAIKIADFGIARIGSSTMTQAGTIMGTPAYMSPEQFQGGAIDQRTDIYSAGVLLYQLLTGRRPFEGNMATIMHDVLTGPAPVPSAVLRTVSPALDGVVARAMSRAAADRFPDAGAFNQALQRALRAPALPAGLGDLAGDDDATVVTSNGSKGVGSRGGGTKPPLPAAAPAGPGTRRATLPVPPGQRRGWLLPTAAAVLLVLGGAGGYWAWQGRTTANQDGSRSNGNQDTRQTDASSADGRGGAGQDVSGQGRAAPDGGTSKRDAPEGGTPGRTAQNGTAGDQNARSRDEQGQGGQGQDGQGGGSRSQTASRGKQPPDTTPLVKPADPEPGGDVRRDPAIGTGTPDGSGRVAQGSTPSTSDPGRLPDRTGPQPDPRPGKPPAAQLADNQASGTQPDTATPADLPPPVRSPAALRAAVADAVRRAPCTAVTGEVRPSGVVALRGIVAGDPGASTLRDAVADAAQGVLTDWNLSAAEGPYCAVLDLVRPLLRPFGSEARTVGLTLKDGKTDLVADELMYPAITLPDSPGYMQVDYIASDGSVTHLFNSTPGPAIPANASRVLGEPKPPGFPGYIVDKPFGTDLLAVFASSTPLFRTARPETETADAYLPALRAALDTAQRSSIRMSAAITMVRTLPKPKF